MRRREVLAALGAGVVGAVAGCADAGSTGATAGPTETKTRTWDSAFEHPGTLDTSFAMNGEYPVDEQPADGAPPAFPDPPAAPDVDESSLRTLDVNGEPVALAPIDAVYAWYRRGEARFVDARGYGQYERAHVYGAVLSPAKPGSRGGGIEGWGKDDRIVTYCACPHHLSSIRAAGLQKAGFTRVYALDEGFIEWLTREHPSAGTRFKPDTEGTVEEWTINGNVDPRYEGEYVWASAGQQYEAAPVRGDGSFTVTVRFTAVSGDTPVTLSTPAYTVTRPLAELASGTVSR